MAHYSRQELLSLGLKKIGNNVLISKDAKLYSPEKISIGNNVRVDDFCILSGSIEIQNNVHLAPGVQLAAGSGEILIKSFAGLAFNTVVTASSDDFSGKSLTGPTVPEQYRKHKKIEKIVVGRHVLIGTSCVILPGVEIGDGSSVGALSLVSKSLEGWGIFIGVPAKKIKNRNKELLALEKEYMNTLKDGE